MFMFMFTVYLLFIVYVVHLYVDILEEVTPNILLFEIRALKFNFTFSTNVNIDFSVHRDGME